MSLDPSGLHSYANPDLVQEFDDQGFIRAIILTSTKSIRKLIKYSHDQRLDTECLLGGPQSESRQALSETFEAGG
jgi:hypothetical protein